MSATTDSSILEEKEVVHDMVVDEEKQAAGLPNGDGHENGQSVAQVRSQSDDVEGSPAHNVPANDWDGPDDPLNPQNWPNAKRYYHTCAPAFMCFVAYVPLP
jgi:hypothetical protein